MNCTITIGLSGITLPMDVRQVDLTPICGEDFCDSCGDCLAHYSDVDCGGEEGAEHTFVKHFDNYEEFSQFILVRNMQAVGRIGFSAEEMRLALGNFAQGGPIPEFALPQFVGADEDESSRLTKDFMKGAKMVAEANGLTLTESLVGFTFIPKEVADITSTFDDFANSVLTDFLKAYGRYPTHEEIEKLHEDIKEQRQKNTGSSYKP